jgi:hypothetical protein
MSVGTIDGVNNVATGTITDNDYIPPGITLSSTPLALDETFGVSQATFSLELTTQPLGSVTVLTVSTDLTEAVVTPPALTFFPTDWAIAQTVTVTGVDDDAVDGNIVLLATVASASTDDSNYNGVNGNDIGVTTTDGACVLWTCVVASVINSVVLFCRRCHRYSFESDLWPDLH